MAAYAALVSVLTIIDQIQNHPRFSISFDKNQIESLGEKVGFLLDFIETDTHGVIIEHARVLERRIASAAYAAEDVIESHVVDQIQAAGSVEGHRLRKVVKDIMLSMRLKKARMEENHASSISMLDLEKVIEDMDSIKKKVMEFRDESGSNEHDMQPTSTTSSSTPRITTDKNTMVGFDEQLISLLDKLTGQRSNRQIIPIVGMGGIGKTTLAKNAYEHSLIAHHFDIRTWVTISQKYNVKELLLQLLSMISSEIDSEHDEQLLGQKLHKILWGRRYLIVIDDIWGIEAWDNVNLFFPENNNGSRIVVTTRISNVATHFDSSLFELSFLDENKSWDLFCKKTFGEAGCPLELEDIGKEIVKKCKGLPLSITVIGGLLGRSHMTQKYWKNIAKDLTSFLNSGEDENCSNILSLSYTYLPAHLKPCFLYMAIFPEDHKILVSRLTKLWVAEGFIKSNESQSSEEIARGYINDLIDRNLILKHTMGSNGNVKNCVIHDLVRDLCLMVAQKEEFICVIEDIPRGTERGRRIVCDKKIRQVRYPFSVFHTVRLAPRTSTWVTSRDGRTFRALRPLRLAPLTRTWVTSIDGRLSNNRLLRVMSSNSEAKKTDLRRHIVDHVNMRYLACTNFKLSSAFVLPSSINIVWSLQTIIIRGKIEAPSQIWEMRQLRHVDIYRLCLPNSPWSYGHKQDECVLPNLQTLKKVVNFTWSKEAYKRVVNVRKLNIVYDDEWEWSNNNDYCLHNICQLHKLESLSCLSYCGDERLRKLTFPSSLKKLKLDGFMLGYEDLTVIGSLPCLEVLKLRNNSIIAREWNPVDGEFLRLKSLLIYGSGLVNWNADTSNFPVLEKLVLEYMDKLDGIPLDIGEIPTLRHIELNVCNESAIISAMKIAEEQEDAGNDILQVRVEFRFEYELQLFQEKMKQSADHSFTRNNFQVVARNMVPLAHNIVEEYEQY
ncbi:PREDICTED: putative late blight resistance protein homolog R1B-17 [Erythranthe guttata]|uniref:putative late blight resistance protein homolog R1B-17 n=1 Tax=Erythranthe guttata TaxID=4155 RepID=UPI00064DD145|nr:PREDICTED: putative late blight resistance protein homolog R1B-17 [Erythranthe guttata]XP_012848187.1 PREDICTED: putative late blight resistance protein homolog R1B-17 [Erythranthe guttata]XP_012848188.1 PREDICTED: putative late blight resistance protein homolog R1B-17 [Erythranthe guttata]|eukprot:XP_012848186.1 PREDICTED: putative late blight resistance protein homolog R1B-17 [Erythranthe guttata]